MSSLPEQTSLVNELLESASRDITAYLNTENPNRKAAGKAAVSSLNAAIRILSTTRHQLLVDVEDAYDVPDWAAGNSGPGLPT